MCQAASVRIRLGFYGTVCYRTFTSELALTQDESVRTGSSNLGSLAERRLFCPLSFSKPPQRSLVTHPLASESGLVDPIATRILPCADEGGRIDAPHQTLGRSVEPTQRHQPQAGMASTLEFWATTHRSLAGK